MTQTAQHPPGTNRYPGNCAKCHTPVNAHAGYIHKDTLNRWVTTCETCATTNNNLEPLYDANGQPLTAGQTGNTQLRQRTLQRCTQCDRCVAWVNNRYGKWYVADTSAYHKTGPYRAQRKLTRTTDPRWTPPATFYADVHHCDNPTTPGAHSDVDTPHT